MVQFTKKAINKILEIIKNQFPAGKRQEQILRISIVGGGCSGFQYHMAFETNIGPLDKIYEFIGADGQKLKVAVDQASMLYLNGTLVDYVETLEGTGFKFDNPNVKSTCGCGGSFQA